MCRNNYDPAFAHKHACTAPTTCSDRRLAPSLQQGSTCWQGPAIRQLCNWCLALGFCGPAIWQPQNTVRLRVSGLGVATVVEKTVHRIRVCRRAVCRRRPARSAQLGPKRAQPHDVVLLHVRQDQVHQVVKPSQLACGAKLYAFQSGSHYMVCTGSILRLSISFR